MRLFYPSLYSSECDSSATACEAFLGKLELPSLNDKQKEEINRPVAEDEVLEAIKMLKGGKPQALMVLAQNFIKHSAKLLSNL